MNYLDTSALVKRFVEERGSDLVDDLFLRADSAATARVAAAEAHAAFARRWRERSLSERDFLRLRRDFDHDWPSLVRVDVTEEVVRRVRELVRRYPLRSYDAVQLAAALELASELRTAVTFVSSNEKLGEAARAERLTVIDPEAPR